MILQGKIGLITVSDIFQFLSLVRITGKLEIEATGKAWVYFHHGELIYARREGPIERLGERLLRLEEITASQLAGALLRMKLEPKKRIGQILVEAGSIAQARLQQVVTAQIRESISEILTCATGEFRFFADVLPEGEDILLDISLDLLLLEGLKKLDERVRDTDSGSDSFSF